MKTTLRIMDQVNIKFTDLDAFTRRKMVDSVKYFLPQARYSPAYKLGRWDGTISYATLAGATYLNLLEKVLPIIYDAGYEIEIQDERQQQPADFVFPEVDEYIVSDRTWPAGHPAEGEPIMVRDYQVKALNTFFRNPQSIQSISTGAGKTLLTAIMSLMCEPYGRTIVIVPSKSLVVQTEEDYVNMGLDVGVFFGERKEYGHTHTICTWQSLTSLAKKTRSEGFSEEDISIGEFLDGVVAVIVDEVHSAKSTELKNLLTGPLAHIPIRWGVTGTVPKDEHDKLSLLIGLGEVVGYITASELQEKGVLSRCHVNVMQMVDDHVEFDSYADEVDYLTSDGRRLGYIAELAKEVREQGNTLILVSKIETGNILSELIEDSVFLSGKDKNSDRQEQYHDVQTANGKVLIATYGIAAVGINIPRIFNLILIEPGKSFVRVIQSIGRGIRKAKDKDYVNIWDITSTCKFSAKHLTARKKFYKEANYPYDTTKIKYTTQSTEASVSQIKKIMEKSLGSKETPLPRNESPETDEE